jgi:hypothetical protein
MGITWITVGIVFLVLLKLACIEFVKFLAHHSLRFVWIKRRWRWWQHLV